MTFPFPFFSVGGGSFEMIFASAGEDPANASSYSWSSAYLAQPGDLVVVGAAGRSSSATTVTSIMIGGASAAINVTNGSSLSPTSIGSRVIQPGDNADIQVNFSGSQGRAGYCCIIIRGFNSAAHYDSGFVGSGTTQSSLSSSLDIPAGGGGFFFLTRNNTGSTTWANATLISDEVSENSTTFSGATALVPAGATGYVATASWSGNIASILAYASWR